MAQSRREIGRLLAEACQGNVEAFAEVFEARRPLVHSLAYRLVGPNDCDDVVMETYLKAWRGLRSFQGRASLNTWLCRIARNCALDFLRRRGRTQARQVSWNDSEQGPTVEDLPDARASRPDREATVRELGEALEEAMAQLSDEHRAAVLLREVDGLSYSEIAAATGVRIGTVMSRLFYAKRRLRQLLIEKGMA